jgi:anti-sigma28 factor (negative regulator of flagellin synthesis)
MPEPDRPRNTPKETAPAAQEKTDRVEISLDARARLAELADRELKASQARPEEKQGRTDGIPEAPQTRIEQIRQKIESGFYDRPEIRDQIVRKLTDDLDIEL